MQPEKTLLSPPLVQPGRLSTAGGGGPVVGWGGGGGMDHAQDHIADGQLAVRTEIQVLKLPQFRVPHATFQSLGEWGKPVMRVANRATRNQTVPRIKKSTDSLIQAHLTAYAVCAKLLL